MEEAIKLVQKWVFSNIDILSLPETWRDDFFCTWSCYILGNKKYLIGNKHISSYFEVTFNNNTNEWYVDVYQHTDKYTYLR